MKRWTWIILAALPALSIAATAQLAPYAGGGLGNGAPCAEAVVNPNQLAASSIGIVFAEDAGAQVRWCGVNGTVRKIAQLGSPVIGVARDDTTGTTYATTAAGALLALDPNGNQTALAIVGLSKPTHLALGGGSLWIADRGANAVFRVTLPCAGTCAAEKVMDASAPRGIAWSGGALYVSDTGNNRVRKLAGGATSTVTSAVDPQGLAVDSAGAVYVAESMRVLRVAGGTATTFAAVPGAVGLAVKTMALPGQVSAREYLFIGAPDRIYAVDVAAVGPVATATSTATSTARPTDTAVATRTWTPAATATKVPTATIRSCGAGEAPSCLPPS